MRIESTMFSSAHRALLGTHSSPRNVPWFFPAWRCSSLTLLCVWAVIMTVVACFSIFRPAALRADPRHQTCGFDDLDQVRSEERNGAEWALP